LPQGSYDVRPSTNSQQRSSIGTSYSTINNNVYNSINSDMQQSFNSGTFSAEQVSEMSKNLRQKHELQELYITSKQFHKNDDLRRNLIL